MPLFFVRSRAYNGVMVEIGQADTGGEALRNEDSPWGKGRDGGEGGGLGPRNPWTEPPPRRKPGGRANLSPAALEAMLRRGRQRFGGRLPDAGDRSFWLWGIVSVLLLWVVLTSVHRIDPSERGVVVRLGRYEGLLGPGLQLTLPAPIDRVVRVPVERENLLEVGSTLPGGEALLVTGDGNLVDYVYAVKWKIRDPRAFLFTLGAQQAEPTVGAAVRSAMRAELAQTPLGQAVGAAGQEAVTGRALAAAQHRLDRWGAGIQLTGIAIRRAGLPEALGEADKDVAAAAEKADGLKTEAHSYAESAADRAAAEVADYDRLYAQYKLSPELTRQRMYFDMMDDVLPKLDKVIVDSPGTQVVLPPHDRSAASGGQP